MSGTLSPGLKLWAPQTIWRSPRPSFTRQRESLSALGWLSLVMTCATTTPSNSPVSFSTRSTSMPSMVRRSASSSGGQSKSTYCLSQLSVIFMLMDCRLWIEFYPDCARASPQIHNRSRPVNQFLWARPGFPLLPSWLAQIQAQQFIFAARVKKSVGEGRVSAHLGREDLRARGGLELRRGGGRANEFSSFRENHQLFPREDKGGRANTVLLPANLARFQLDATQAAIISRIGPAMDAIEKAAVMNAGRIMIGKEGIGGPDFLRTAFLDPEQDRAQVVTGGEENQVADDQRSGRADRIAGRRTERKLEKDLAVGRLNCGQTGAREEEGVAPSVDGRCHGG